MNKREYFRALDAAARTMDEQVAAIKTTWRLLHGTEPPAERPEAPMRGIAGAIAAKLLEMPERFTSSDVVRCTGISHSTVTHTLNRMAARGELKCESKGRGKRPSVFVKESK